MRKLTFIIVAFLLLLPGQSEAWDEGGSSSSPSGQAENCFELDAMRKNDHLQGGGSWDDEDGSRDWVQEKGAQVEAHFGESRLTKSALLSLQKVGESAIGVLTHHMTLPRCCGPIAAVADVAGWIEGDQLSLTVTWRGLQSCQCESDSGSSWVRVGYETGTVHAMELLLSVEGNLLPRGNIPWFVWNNDEPVYPGPYLPVPKSE